MKGLTNKVLVALSLLSVAGSVFGEGSTFSAGIDAGLKSLSDYAKRDPSRSLFDVGGAIAAIGTNLGFRVKDLKVLNAGIDKGLSSISALANKLSTSRLLERVAMKDGLVNKMGEVLHTVGAGKKTAVVSASLAGLVLKTQINIDPIEKWLIGNGWL